MSSFMRSEGEDMADTYRMRPLRIAENAKENDEHERRKETENQELNLLESEPQVMLIKND